MTILVTGGAGYIGSHVVRQLSEASYPLVVFDNLSTGSPKALIHNEQLIVGDLEDLQALEAVFGRYQIDSILHFAASVNVNESIQNPAKYYNNNAMNVLRLLEICAKYKVKNFIFSSTAAVYAPPEKGFVNENSAIDPLTPYGRAKYMAENMLRDIASVTQMNYIILRYFNVAGADPLGRMGQYYPEASHLLKRCCLAALNKASVIEIYGTDYPTKDGTGFRDYIHVEDLARAHILALDYLKKNQTSDLFNVGYGHGYSVREVINMTKQVSGNDFTVIESPRRAGDAAAVIADSSHIKQVLNWQPKHDKLELIIRDALRWEQHLSEIIQ